MEVGVLISVEASVQYMTAQGLAEGRHTERLGARRDVTRKQVPERKVRKAQKERRKKVKQARAKLEQAQERQEGVPSYGAGISSLP